ncbi:hypothetical protein BC826DRAFT_1012916 [Russula brevipes]|nr:hypothetical protein BC826DRAFT_1012916 [Russula brevipes]
MKGKGERWKGRETKKISSFFSFLPSFLRFPISFFPIHAVQYIPRPCHFISGSMRKACFFFLYSFACQLGAQMLGRTSWPRGLMHMASWGWGRLYRGVKI